MSNTTQPQSELQQRLMAFSKKMDQCLQLPPNCKLERYFSDIFTGHKVTVIDVAYRAMFPLEKSGQIVVEKIYLNCQQIPKVKTFQPFHKFKKLVQQLTSDLYKNELEELGNKCFMELFLIEGAYQPQWIENNRSIKDEYTDFHNLINFNFPPKKTKLDVLASAFGKKPKLRCPFTYETLAKECGWVDIPREGEDNKKPKNPIPQEPHPKVLAKKDEESTMFVIPKGSLTTKTTLQSLTKEKKGGAVAKEIPMTTEISSIPKITRESVVPEQPTHKNERLEQESKINPVKRKVELKDKPNETRVFEVFVKDDEINKKDDEIENLMANIKTKLTQGWYFSNPTPVEQILNRMDECLN